MPRRTVKLPIAGAPTAAQRWAGRILALAGWRADVAWPPAPRGVIVVYPHTSNWDFAFGYLARLAAGLPVSWMGKDTLFRWPVAGLLRRLGGIPVNRREPGDLIDRLAAELASRDWMWLAIAPEGTRARTDHWKSGFHRLALAAGVPVGLAFIDYRRRVVGMNAFVTLTGDREADLAAIRAAYAGKAAGKHPDQAGEIRFHEPHDQRGGGREHAR